MLRTGLCLAVLPVIPTHSLSAPRVHALLRVEAKKGANRGKVVGKEHLPTKVCATCGLPFTWRKKWKDVWDEVRYCSERCRGNRGRKPTEPESSGIPAGN
ncbi:hypothetical protein Vretimale_17005 [Volvox reticuliferus]|uniref:Uncharacterized protein n=1 Tax=Volvox reticuliferus TaxID=1737510 RepID=A0A8J4CE49_9CHLO|nr:hypothetical protein Vretifemale_7810 [Volvox reticuliferus]GIM14001.1 hypothetical protein Vretimale_17005 [Volvox reticuliferus]